MAMSYTTLTASKAAAGSIRSWANKSTVEAEQVLEEAESWIYRRVRVREMRSVDTSLSIAAGESSLALPTGYLGPITFMLTSPGRYRLEPKTVYDVEEFRPYSSAGVLQPGLPRMFYTDGTLFHFNASADRTYTTRIVFWKQPTALSSGNTTNFLTDKYPRLLRCACMAFASEFLKDYNAMDKWLMKAQAEIDQINVEDDLNAGSLEPYAMVE